MGRLRAQAHTRARPWGRTTEAGGQHLARLREQFPLRVERRPVKLVLLAVDDDDGGVEDAVLAAEDGHGLGHPGRLGSHEAAEQHESAPGERGVAPAAVVEGPHGFTGSEFREQRLLVVVGQRQLLAGDDRGQARIIGGGGLRHVPGPGQKVAGRIDQRTPHGDPSPLHGHVHA